MEKWTPLDRTTPRLVVRIEKAWIVIPRVSDIIVEPLLAKLTFDWLFFLYLLHLPDPAWQVSFLAPWFLSKKPGEWQNPWEQLWAEVFPTPIYHGGVGVLH